MKSRNRMGLYRIEIEIMVWIGMIMGRECMMPRIDKNETYVFKEGTC